MHNTVFICACDSWVYFGKSCPLLLASHSFRKQWHLGLSNIHKDFHFPSKWPPWKLLYDTESSSLCLSSSKEWWSSQSLKENVWDIIMKISIRNSFKREEINHTDFRGKLSGQLKCVSFRLSFYATKQTFLKIGRYYFCLVLSIYHSHFLPASVLILN